MKGLLRVLATLGPVGYAPVAPATAASAVVTAIAWFVPSPGISETLALIAVGTIAAMWISDEAEKELGHDAKPIVVDEAVGQSLALLFVPRTLLAFGCAFLLFRLFDIWKPLGAKQAQNLEGGLGVVADDVIAGLSACAVFHLAYLAARLLGWAA